MPLSETRILITAPVAAATTGGDITSLAASGARSMATITAHASARDERSNWRR